MLNYLANYFQSRETAIEFVQKLTFLLFNTDKGHSISLEACVRVKNVKASKFKLKSKFKCLLSHFGQSFCIENRENEHCSRYNHLKNENRYIFWQNNVSCCSMKMKLIKCIFLPVLSPSVLLMSLIRRWRTDSSGTYSCWLLSKFTEILFCSYVLFDNVSFSLTQDLDSLYGWFVPVSKEHAFWLCWCETVEFNLCLVAVMAVDTLSDDDNKLDSVLEFSVWFFKCFLRLEGSV